VGKTWLGCALANQACRLGYTVAYLKMPGSPRSSLSRTAAVDMRSTRAVAKTDVLLMDDFAMRNADRLGVICSKYSMIATAVAQPLQQARSGDLACARRSELPRHWTGLLAMVERRPWRSSSISQITRALSALAPLRSHPSAAHPSWPTARVLAHIDRCRAR